jgi:hypothetical protein
VTSIARRARMRGLLLLVGVAACLAACGGATPDPPASASAPSGSLGVITAASATRTVAALCELRNAVDRQAADATFFDLAHEPLHVLAAATERVDRIPAAGLLEAKQVVEGDLRSDRLPATFGNDVAALLVAARNALDTVGLPAPGC